MTVRSLVSALGSGLGVAVPIAILRFGDVFDWPTFFFVWPSSVGLTVPHVWDSERAANIFLATVILLNGSLYAAVVFFVTRHRASESWRSSKWLGRAIVISIFVSVVAITGVIAVFGRPVFYQIPSQYRGWIVLEYANPSCPRLTSRGINQVLEISSNGHFCTSSPVPLPDRFRRAMYAYSSNHLTERLFPCGTASADVCVRAVRPASTSEFPQRVMFVGTPQEFREAQRTQKARSTNAAERRPSNEPLERPGADRRGDDNQGWAGR